MNEIERRAQEHVRRSEWEKALECFEQLLITNQNNRNGIIPKEKVIAFLIGKSECNYALGRNDCVIQDCRKALKLYIENDLTGTQKDKARRLLIQSLVRNKRYSEAESVVKEWLVKGKLQQDTRKILEQLKSRFHGHRDQNVSPQKLEEDLIALEASLESWIIAERPKKNSGKTTDAPNDKSVELDKRKTNSKMNFQQQHQQQMDKNNTNNSSNLDEFSCSYCSLRFHDMVALRSHCLTGSHQTVIMSDEGRDWKYRPPPR